MIAATAIRLSWTTNIVCRYLQGTATQDIFKRSLGLLLLSGKSEPVCYTFSHTCSNLLVLFSTTLQEIDHVVIGWCRLGFVLTDGRII
jgi:hypothetical protein